MGLEEPTIDEANKLRKRKRTAQRQRSAATAHRQHHHHQQQQDATPLMSSWVGSTGGHLATHQFPLPQPVPQRIHAVGVRRAQRGRGKWPA